MRLFVALDVDEAVRARLAAATGAVRERADEGWRWTRPAGWHVTLAFLGEVDDERVDEVGAVAGRAVAGAGALTLRLDGVGHFGRRVLHAVVADEPAGAVADVGARVQTALAAAGLPVRQRPVTPHLTLARARGRARPEVPELTVPGAAWQVGQAGLYRSRLHPDGARYEVVAWLPLV